MGNVVKMRFTARSVPARTTMTSALIWTRTVGDRALAPVLAGIMCVAALDIFHLQVSGWLLLAFMSVLTALIMTIPVSVLIYEPDETWVERRAREKRQARARAELATFGLSPEQYIAIIPANDWLRRARAAEKFGL